MIAILAFKTYYQSGAFNTITNESPGTTQRLDGVPGVEDITVDQATGIAFLSSMDRWQQKKDPTIDGAIYTLALNDTLPRPVVKTVDLPFEFKPHGISLYHSREGKTILFVINHRKEANYVEVFEYRNDSLIHRESITDPLMISPNDIVGVDERSFYFTNDHNEKASAIRMIKDLLAIGTGNVVYYNNGKASLTSVQGVQYPNGINLSALGTTLFVASTTGKEIIVCGHDASSGELKERTRIACHAGVDNIELGGDGALWVGCHPQMLKFLSHANDQQALSPSQILKLTPLPDGSFKQETIYMNDGSEISASSVGAPYENKLLIGPVFQRHILVLSIK
ncbi:MAG TPA: SMP-30/gluconolactonase/LRE family protein [Cyclobacteriaceae bacterium]|nr:SMP-30/gluconolactonase/LRE family protein [Cyclobacteriaceae bacterium]